MSPSIVEQYVSDLKRMNLQDFISINHPLEKSNNRDKVGMKEYIHFFSPEMVLGMSKRVPKTSIFSDFLDDDFFDSSDNNLNKPGYQLLHFQR